MRVLKGLLITAFGMAVVFAMFGFFRSNSPSTAVLGSAEIQESPPSQENASDNSIAPNSFSKKEFKTQLKEEAYKVGQLTSEPESIEQGLNEWAQALTAEDFVQIRESIFNDPKISGDEVALSLDLLGRSQAPESVALLLDYVLKGPQVPTSEKATFQLLALEGLIDQSLVSKNPTSLKKVMAHTDDALLAKRTAQGLKALEGKAPAPEETDQKALAELLKRQ